MPSQWIVLLEAVKSPSSAGVDKETLSRLLDGVGHAQPVALHSADRYAVQLHLLAGDPVEALASGLSAWSDALATVGVAPWELVRAEVMTDEEMALELSLAEAADVAAKELADDGLNASFEDIVSGLATEQELADAAAASDLRWRLMLQGSKEILTVLSRDWMVLFSLAPDGSNPLVGEGGDGMTFAASVHPEDAEGVKAALQTALACTGEPVVFLARFGGEDEWRWYESVATNLLEEPLVGGIVVSSRDVTENTQLTNRLAEMSVRDELTGLVHRSVFLDQLEFALARSSTTSHIAVFFVDIDNFRGFIDVHGTAVGDQLLIAVATRLSTDIPCLTAAARLGGDEFAVLCEGVSNNSEVAAIAKQIGDLLGSPVTIDSEEVTVGASIGCAMGTPGMFQPATLLRHAEVAMYRARRGQQRYEIYRKNRPSHSKSDTPRP